MTKILNMKEQRNLHNQGRYRINPYLLFIILYFVTAITVQAVPTFDQESEGTIREITFPTSPTESSIAEMVDNPVVATSPDVVTEEEKKIFDLDAFVKQHNRLVDKIDAASVIDLPVGIVKTVGALQYTIVISKMTTTPDKGTFLEVCMSFTLPQNGKQLAFIAKKVQFTNAGGIIGEPKLELIGNKTINLGTQSIKLVLKGTAKDVVSKESVTNVTFDCNGYKSMSIAADVEFSPIVFVPENSDGSLREGETLRSSFTATTQNFNDLVVDLSVAPFQIKGIKGLGFSVISASLDFSDLQNPASVIFPTNYLKTTLGAGVTPNLWRGLFIKEATIKLPKEIKRKTTPNDRVSFSGTNLIIDERGFTGVISAPNLFPITEGNMSGWAYSITEFSAGFEASQFKSAGFKGKMNIPILKDNSELDYSAIIGLGGNYSFTISPKNNVEFDIWAAKATILPTSTVTIAAVNGTFKPQANLNGTLSITKSTEQSSGSSNTILNVGSLEFERLVVKTEAPYLTLGAVKYNSSTSSSSSLAAFPLTFTDIGIQTQGNKTGIAFTAKVNFMKSEEEGFSGTGGLIIWGERSASTNRWKYKNVEVTKIGVAVGKPGAFEIKGEVIFFDNDPTYGKGFKGTVSAKFKGDIGLDAMALFGGVGDLRYWYADGMYKGFGIPLGFISIYGFGGGVYHHMKQQGYKDPVSSNIGSSMSGIVYVPTPDVSLGLNASVALATTGVNEVINADVTFGISFSSSGGLSQVSFNGNAYLITSEYLSAATDVVSNAKGLAGGATEPAKTTNGNRAQIWGNINLLWDAKLHSFHGELNIYANVAGGLLRGIGPGNRAGWAVMHFDPKDWYIYVGTPADRCGIKIANFLTMTSYFMTGTKVLDSPPPPPEISSLFPNIDTDYMRELNALGAGRGFAFGASLDVNTGDVNFLIFYAKLRVFGGFDIMLKNYGEARCEGRSGVIGINGWYANGQAYALVEGAVGIKVDLRFYKGKYEIFYARVGAFLQAQGPNPFWMQGGLDGEYRILNGLVKGRCHFEFEVGDKCKLTNVNPLAGITMISQITPEPDKKDVDAFTSPQAIFNMSIGEEFAIKDETGKVRTFRVKLEKFDLKAADNTIIPGIIEWNADRTVAAYKLTEVLPSTAKLKATALVIYEEKIAGQWQAVLVSNKPITEMKESSFTSGIAPTTIPLSNIAYSYPIINQYNFYKNEYGQGYIKLITGQSTLFTPPSGFVQKGRMRTTKGEEVLFAIGYDKPTATVTYNIPSSIKNSTIYSFEIVNIPTVAPQAIDRNVTSKTEQTLDPKAGASTAEITTKSAQGSIATLAEKKLLSYYFRTSMYNSFTEKFNKIKFYSTAVVGVRYQVTRLSNYAVSDEQYEKIELLPFGNNASLLSLTASLDETIWYKNSIYDLMYKYYPIANASITYRTVAELGAPPTKATYIYQSPLDKVLTDNDITGLNSASTSLRHYFIYDVDNYVDQDFYDLQSKLAALYKSKRLNAVDYQKAKTLLETTVCPKMVAGDYPIDIKYTLPGIMKQTSINRFVFKWK